MTTFLRISLAGVLPELTIHQRRREMASAPNPVIVGSNLTYSLTVTNRGPATASSVSVTNALPTGVVFVSANVSQTCG